MKPQFQEILRLSEENVGKGNSWACFFALFFLFPETFYFLNLKKGETFRWSLETNTIDVNKLFGVTYGCSPFFVFFFSNSKHVSAVIQRCSVSFGCQVIYFGIVAIYEMCFLFFSLFRVSRSWGQDLWQHSLKSGCFFFDAITI